MSGLDEQAVLAACEAYHADLPTHDYPSRWAMEQAIRAYLASVTPADVGEEPVAWRMRSLTWLTKQPGYWVLLERKPTSVQSQTFCYEIEPLYSATALERVVRERDEARRERDHWTGEARRLLKSGQEALDRLESAEAKLAEARKVIEPFAARAGKLDGIWKDHETNWGTEYAGVAITIGHLRAARRWIEETK